MIAKEMSDFFHKHEENLKANKLYLLYDDAASLSGGCTQLTVFLIEYMGLNVQKIMEMLDHKIPDNFLTNYDKLRQLQIPMNIDTIGAYAFANCKKLQVLSFSTSNSKGCRIIERGAFENCSSIKNVILPESVRFLQDDIFKGCSSLAGIEFKNSDEITLGNNAVPINVGMTFILHTRKAHIPTSLWEAIKKDCNYSIV